MKEKVTLFWFRRDLRLQDNLGLYKALQSKFPVLPIFIFDPEILNELAKDDARVTFIFNILQKLNKKLQNHNSSISIYYGKPELILEKIIADYSVQQLICNGDYEPYARKRDDIIKQLLLSKNIAFNSYKDHVIFQKDEVVTSDGSPYIVFTPYMKTWKQKFEKSEHFKINDLAPYLGNLYQNPKLPNLSLEQLGFKESRIKTPNFDISSNLIEDYEDNRNFPAKDATSHLGPHLRFGTVSIREVIDKAISQTNKVFWHELIWREFFIQILWHFPETVNSAFKKKYDRIQWLNNEGEFTKWKEGKTGYPLVDAGMRQLNNN